MANHQLTGSVNTPQHTVEGDREATQRRRWLPAAIIVALVLFHTICNVVWLHQDGRSMFGDPGNHARVSFLIFDILRNPSIDLPARIIDATTYWPPLAYLVTQPLYALLGIGSDVTAFSTTIFFGLLIVFTYLLGKRLYGITAGLFSAFLIAFYPIVYTLSRTYYVDLPLASMVTITFYFMVRSETFSRRRDSLLFGLSLALTALTKQGFFIIVTGPVLLAVGMALFKSGMAGWRELLAWRPGASLAPQGAGLTKRLVNMLLIGLVFGVIAVPWYVGHTGLLTWQTDTLTGVAEGDFAGLPYWFYVTKLDDILLIWPMTLFVVGLVLGILNPKRNWLPLVWFISAMIILPLITREHPRYLLPLMPAIALLSAQWIVDLKRVAVRRALIGVTVVFQVVMFFFISWGTPQAWNRALNVPIQNDYHPFSIDTRNRPLLIDPLAFLYYQYPPMPHRWPVKPILDTAFADVERDRRPDELSRLVPLSKILDFEFSTFSYEVELTRRLGRPGAQHVAVDDVSLQPDYLADFFDIDYVIFKSNNTGFRKNMVDIRDAWLRGDKVLHDRFSVIGRWDLQDGSYAELLKRNGPPLAGLSPEELQPIVRYLLSLTPDSRKAQRLQAQLTFDERTPEQISAAVVLWQEEVRLRPNDLPAWRQLVDALLATGDGETAIKLLDEAAQKPILAPATVVEIAIQKARVLDAMGQTEAAQAANQEALRLAPNSAAAHVAMASFWIRHSQSDQALPHIQEARRLAPSIVDVLVELATVYDDAGQTDQAIASLKEAIAFAPKRREAYASLASIYRTRNENAAAVKTLEEGAAKGALAAADYVALGDSYQSAGSADQARTAYQSTIDLFPGDPAGYLALGRYLANAKDVAGAQAVYQAGLETIPGDVSLLDGLAQLGMQDQDALAALGTVLEQQGPDDPTTYLALSQSQLEAGNITGAEVVLKQGIEKGAQPISLWLALGKLYADQNRIQEAEDAYQEAVRLSPDNASTHLEQATFYETLARSTGADDPEPYWTAARDAYQRALDLNPTLVRPYTGLALYHRIHKDQAAAIDLYKKGMEILPNEAWLAFGLAQTYNETGDFEAALPYYQKAIQLQPDNALFQAQLGNIASRLKQWEPAGIAYAEALRLKPDYAVDPNFMLAYGFVDLKRERFDIAAQTFRQVLDKDPANASARFSLGQALEGNGDTDGAIAAYRSLIQQVPESDLGKQAAARLEALEQK